MLNFAYLKDLDDVDTFNIRGSDRGKESEQGKGWVDVTDTHKNLFVINRKTVTVSLALGEGVTCNTIFPWPFLQTIKVSIMTESNDLVSVLLGELFRLGMMVPQKDKEATKTSEGLPVSLSVKIQEKQDNMKDRGSSNNMV